MVAYLGAGEVFVIFLMSQVYFFLTGIVFDENSKITLSTDTVNFEDVGISVLIPKEELDQGGQMDIPV